MHYACPTLLDLSAQPLLHPCCGAPCSGRWPYGSSATFRPLSIWAELVYHLWMLRITLSDDQGTALQRLRRGLILQPHLWWHGGSCAIVAALGACLVTPAPVGPLEQRVCAGDARPYQPKDEASHLRHG